MGYALDVATLQQIAYEHGISQSINTMTQAQKSQLRYLAIMEQSGNAMGDMARTIDTGANRMRVLQQQFIQLSRAMGNLFVPIIEVVLPYVQAFVEVLTEAIHGLATLAGFKIPEVELPDLDDATGGLDDELEDANKAAKELRRTLTAFDELNILNAPKEEIKLPDNDLNVELPEYEFLKEFKNNAEELKEQMKGLLDIVLAVGAGLLAWKVSSILFRDLSTLSKILTGIPKLLKNLGSNLGSAFGYLLGGQLGPLTETAAKLAETLKFVGVLAAIAAMILRFIDLYKNSEKFRKGLESIGKLFSSIGEAIGNIARKFGNFVLNLFPEDAKNSIVTFFDWFHSLAEELDLDLWDVAFAIAGIALNATPIGKVLLIFEGVTIAIRAIGAAANESYTGIEDLGSNLKWVAIAAAAVGLAVGVSFGLIPGLIAAGVTAAISFAAIMTQDCIPAIELFGDEISEETKAKVQPFVEQLRELDDKFATLKWTGEIIDDSVVEDVSAKVKAIVDTIVNELDSDKNEILATLNPLKGALGIDMYNEILASSQRYYDSAASQVEEGQARINKIMQDASEQNRSVTKSEWEEITEIQSTMQEIGLRNLSETEIEFNSIMERMKDNATRVSLEQASEILKNAQSTRDGAIDAAYEQFSKTKLLAENMQEVGAITSEAYSKMLEAAEKVKDGTIESAEMQFNKILELTKGGLGENARYFDFETLNIRTKWSIFCEYMANAWADMMDDFTSYLNETGAGISKWWSEKTQQWSNGLNEMKEGAAESWEEIVGVFSNSLDAITNFFSETIPNWWNEYIAPWFTAEKWQELGKQAIDGLLNGLSAIGDKIKSWGAGVVSAVKDFFGIHSPSTVFRDKIGLNLGLGIAEGLADSVRPITIEANSLANSISGAFDKMSFNIPATMSIKTPKISSVKLASPTQGVQIPHYDVTSTAGRVRAFMGPETGAALVTQMSDRTAVAHDSQSSLSSGVSDANKDVVNVVYAMAAQIVRAIEDKDLSVNLDGEKIARTTNPYLNKINRLQGQSLVHK